MKRALAVGLGILLLLPLLVVAGFLLFFDADAFRPRVVEAVQRATGREFRIEGRLHLTPALSPTLAAEGLVLANVPGGSAPEMLRIAEAELSLALLPLLSGRIELAHLRLEGGRLLLERENWRFARPAAPEAAPPAPASQAAPQDPPGRPMELDLRAVTLRDWRVTAGGETLHLPELRLTGSGPASQLDLTARLATRGTEARIEGRLGAPAAWNGPAPWPFQLTAALPFLRLTAEGQQTQGDWRTALRADIPRLDALAPLARRPLPALTGITLRAAAEVTGGVARLAGLDGEATGGEVGGFTLTNARFIQTGQEAPLTLEANGQLRGEAVRLTAETRPMALAAGTPAPLALWLSAGGATASLAGEWPGALRLTATAPELARLSALAGRPLPPLRDASLSAAFTALGPMFGEGVRLGEFALASSAGDLAGALEWRWAPRPTVSGRVTSTRMDLNALRLPPPPQAVAAPPAAVPPTPAPAAAGRVIPDTPLDLAALRLFDADVSFTLGEVIERELTLRQVEGRLVNAGARARLEPFAATLPGGRLAVALAADATGAAPAVQIRGGGQGLDPTALLGAFGLSGPLTGRTDLDLNLRGEGATWRAVAASATGHFGLAVVEGRLSGGPAQVMAQIPGFAGGVPVNCLALRGEADRGLVRFSAFHLDGAAGRLAGEGGMSLRDETLAIRMQGDLRLAGVRVRAPIPLGGTLAAPRLELAALTEGAVGSLLGAPSGGSGGGAGGAAMPDCAGALRIARGGREGPVPQGAPVPPGQSQPSINNLLRGLLGR
ncbi:AsmA family protein [Sediminicoccus rosea]|uniref:AsmA family protein n=1 Tax=Sediminicoccus rosea TaxID=1225128 RepID=A0ABZ0PMA2_9PROT|nr:AsmA family protein [Sediminicoccus rosea]WPB86502.1 AsmA family protein [Sediminicoccus rosea]